MSVLALLFILAALAGVAWLINARSPFSPGWKLLFNVVLGIIAVCLCLYAFGIWDEVRRVQVPKI